MKTSLSPTFYLRAQKKFGGKYVARKRNQILASAKTLKDLLRLMKSMKISHRGEVSIGYVPTVNHIHVYIVR